MHESALVHDASGGSGASFRFDDDLRDLIAAVAKRDEAAFTKLYAATSSRACSMALRITRQPEAAEEVVVDCYWQVWRDCRHFDASRGRVLTWVLTICRSRALDYLRRKDIADTVADMDRLQSGQFAADDDPLSILDARDRASAVQRALQLLHPAERQLIALAFFRGLTHREIASVCMLPFGSVKTTIRRALQKMRETLDGEGRQCEA